MREIAQRVQDVGIKVVAFDMDQTAVGAHSHGRLARGDPLSEYLGKIKPDFVALIPALLDKGIGVALATHSDLAEASSTITRSTHVLGDDLALAVLQHVFPEEIVSRFKIVAYNPRVHVEGTDEAFLHKRYHMRELCEHFATHPREILFFDDVDSIVTDASYTCGVCAFKVDPAEAFEVTDILKALDILETHSVSTDRSSPC